MNLSETLAVVGAPVGGVAGYFIASPHGVWWSVGGVIAGLVVGFYAGSLFLLLLDFIFPPRAFLSGGRRLRQWRKEK